jgi:hypothetical protein
MAREASCFWSCFGLRDDVPLSFPTGKRKGGPGNDEVLVWSKAIGN